MVFQDGKVVFVRHGGVFVGVSANRLCKVNGSIKDSVTQGEDTTDDKYDKITYSANRQKSLTRRCQKQSQVCQRITRITLKTMLSPMVKITSKISVFTTSCPRLRNGQLLQH